MTSLSNIVVVLVHTSHPGNIGAAARAMKTMGIDELRLVRPARFPSAEASERASGADDLLHHAAIFDDLDAALADTVWAVATSARPRHLDWPELDPAECAGEALRYAAEGKVALVFGRERSGLTNTELERCQALVRIPANPRFSSLNIAAAVQVISYALRARALHEGTMVESDREDSMAPGPAGEGRRRALASPSELEGLYAHLECTLTEIGFYDPDKPKLLMRRLRRLYARAELERSELNILRGILSATEEALRSREDR